MKRNILLNPGPATTTDSVKQALVVPDICPREKEFQDLIESIRKDIVKIAGGNKNYTAILFAGSGTAAMEATMTSIAYPDQYALVVSNGAYGERFRTIAEYCNIANIEIIHDYGQAIDFNKINRVFESFVSVNSLFVTHHETSTGILNPIEKVGKIANEQDLMYAIDSISSFGGIPFSIQRIKADFIMSTSNKCLQGMPGVSFVIAKKDTLESIRYNARSLYLNLYNQYEYLESYGQMPFTPPVQVMYALRQAIDELFKEGLENRYERYKKNHQLLVEGMKDRDFKLFLTQQVEHSCILETFYEPKNFNFQKFHDKLYKKGFTIYPGKLDDKKTFRLSVMGDLKENDIKNFLEAVDDVL